MRSKENYRRLYIMSSIALYGFIAYLSLLSYYTHVLIECLCTVIVSDSSTTLQTLQMLEPRLREISVLYALIADICFVALVLIFALDVFSAMISLIRRIRERKRIGVTA